MRVPVRLFIINLMRAESFSWQRLTSSRLSKVKCARYSGYMTPLRFCRLRPCAVLSVLALSVACTPPSQQDLQSAQALSELGESFNDVRLEQQQLQDQVDSLKFVLARQDSVIRTLANLAGVQVPR